MSDTNIRTVTRSREFVEFYNSLEERVREKLDYVVHIIESERVVSTKFAKKLVGTQFYEMRISVGNEYRVIMFAIDNTNLQEAELVVLLNGFVKKSTNDYRKETKKAETILKNIGL